jgi:plastocyanin
MSKAMLALALLIPMFPPQEKTFTVSGTLKFVGPVPEPKVNKAMNGDQACCALHPDKLPNKDDLVIDAAGGVRWAFVYIKKGLEGKQFDPPAEPVLIDQVGCTYTPHMAGAMVGQTVNFRNSDPLSHNVHGLPFSNKEFNFGQVKGSVNAVKFASQEVPVKVKCDIHPWMGSWIGVLEHPFFAVSDAEGKFEIKNLPPGNYVLGVWHEKLQAPDQNLVVQGAVKTAFTLK